MAENQATLSDVLGALYAVIQARKLNAPPGSYTASLFAKGRDEIVKKVGEEAVEVIVAACGQGRERVVYESADLLYHLLVLLVEQDVDWSEIEAELKRRMK